MKKIEITVECTSCGGTGVYSGFAEPKGVAVVCLGCGGTGEKKLSFIPFTKRKERRGIKIVRRSKGFFLPTGIGPTGGSVTYAEFKRGKMPS